MSDVGPCDKILSSRDPEAVTRICGAFFTWYGLRTKKCIWTWGKREKNTLSKIYIKPIYKGLMCLYSFYNNIITVNSNRGIQKWLETFWKVGWMKDKSFPVFIYLAIFWTRSGPCETFFPPTRKDRSRINIHLLQHIGHTGQINGAK